MTSSDVIVIGGGIAGVSAGAELAARSAQHGWDFAAIGQDRYRLSHRVSGPEAHEI